MKKEIYSLVINSEDEIEKIIDDNLSLFESGTVIELNGNLGAGKTTFVKRLCNRFNANDANSPTFAIVNVYKGDKKFYHFDFYRINRLEELYDIGIEEYFTEDAIVLIEWAKMFQQVLPKNTLEIKIDKLENNSRKFTILR